MWSFVIPAHDEAALIGDTLQHLHLAAREVQRARPGFDYQVIVVADGCSDATADIACTHDAEVIEIADRHIAAARNAGAAIARGQVLCFVDADTRLNATLLLAACAALDAGVVGGGAWVCLYGEVRWHERWAERLFGWAFRVSGIAPGCFIFCTRHAFDACGGFDATWYAGEDVALSRALSRHGRFVVLREPVFTSDRKLRSHGAVERWRLLLTFAFHRRAMLRSRHRLDFWYRRR